MNVSYLWLRSILPSLALSPRDVADRLAMLGAPVDELTDLGAPLRDVRIARVLEVQRHPNADRLSLCKVDAGTGEALSVVCGAPNVRAGAYYPFAPAGASLPGGLTIRRSRIRGEESNGMLCSARELELGRDHEGILELHGEFRPGDSFIESVGLNDTRMVIDVTPNRPDLLSHWGVARDLSEDGERSMRLPRVPGGTEPAVEFVQGGTTAEASGVRVTLEDAIGCPRYIGAVIRGVRVAPSPEWLAARLRAVGLRPINNVVDATNWVLYELGQPLHAFDLGLLGNRIVVRRARAGESLVTLDGDTRRLTPDVLVIADESKPVALAGIMGGQETEVTDSTTNVLLECALFEARTIRGGRRQLGMSTDASYRFERGVDPDVMQRAVRRAIELIVATTNAAPEQRIAVAEAALAEPATVTLRAARAARVLGVSATVDELAALLEPLGFATLSADTEKLTIRVPGHRRYDVWREDDLIEEVARRRGYDTFPDEVRPFRSSVVPDDAMAQLEDRMRDLMVGRGFLEARSLPLVGEADGDVALQLPLATTESRLRRALLPGLLHRVEANFNRGARDVRLFEIGTTFARGLDSTPTESTRLAAVLTGARVPDHWTGRPPTFDLWDLSGLMTEVAAELSARIEPGDPGDANGITRLDAGTIYRTIHASSARPVGVGGRVANSAIDAPAWAEAVWGFEIDLRTEMTQRQNAPFRPLPSQPPVDRDIALVVAQNIPAASLADAIRSAGGSLLESAEVFDVYEGKGLPSDSRSVAFRLRFRAPDRTLTVAEVDTLMGRILKRLKDEHNAQRRG
jgi:phenylalanyl-tRNA synthetase beta chain